MNPVPIDDDNNDEAMVPMDALELGTFWSAVCKPGKTTPFVPPPLDANLHVSQARAGSPSAPRYGPLHRLVAD